MNSYNKRNPQDPDETGAAISWIIIFILMFAFPPVGLLLLVLRMRSYAKPIKAPVRKTALLADDAADKHILQDSKKKSKKNKGRTKLDKKSGKFISTVLLLISAALLIIGANTIAGAARDIWGSGINSWLDFWIGIFYFTGGFISFFSRKIVTRRFSRYKSHYAFLAGKGFVPISDIAQTAGLSTRAAKRDLQTMINSGYFDSGAYIDNDLDIFVMSAEAADLARKYARAAQEVVPPPEAAPENRYMAAVVELRSLKSSITDATISGKVDRIEELTCKIFRIVEENPEKESQIKRFMSYYLPTTFKMLRSYSTLEKQGIKGDNIMASKESIGRILDTLATGFEQQLDQLFQADAIDIAADINVIENLMQQDGLSGEKSVFRTMESN